jgi:hypothetical protein
MKNEEFSFSSPANMQASRCCFFVSSSIGGSVGIITNWFHYRSTCPMMGLNDEEQRERGG